MDHCDGSTVSTTGVPAAPQPVGSGWRLHVFLTWWAALLVLRGSVGNPSWLPLCRCKAAEGKAFGRRTKTGPFSCRRWGLRGVGRGAAVAQLGIDSGPTHLP